MAKHLIVFGHGNGDTGTTSSNRTEADTVRKLKPYLEKWGKQSKDSFTFYNGNLFKDRAMHKQKGYDTVTEIHLDGPRGNGGHVIINANFKPNNIDKRLRDIIKKHFGIVGYLQKNDGFSYRTDLYNINQSRTHGIDYRMLELFFLSNEQHYNHYMSNLDQIAKEIVEAISNTKVSGSAKPAPSKPKPSKPSISSWTEVKGNWTGQTLKRGQYGKPVRQLQELLASKHYYPNKGAKNNGIDGYFGADTLDAVKRYQSMHGLAVDGLPGKATYASLKGSTNKPKPKPKPKQAWTGQVLRQGNRGSAVRQLQQMLSAKHYYPDKGAPNNGVDGIYGAKTADAVRRYQTMHGLKVDGIAGRGTYNSLRK